MNIPATNFKIKINPYVVDVIYQNTVDVGDKKDNFGAYNFSKLKISISRKMNTSSQQLQNTLIHEVMHVMWDTAGLAQFNVDVSEQKATLQEETIVERFANSWHAFINDNSFLFETPD